MANVIIPQRWSRQPNVPTGVAAPWRDSALFLHNFGAPEAIKWQATPGNPSLSYGYEAARKDPRFQLEAYGSGQQIGDYPSPTGPVRAFWENDVYWLRGRGTGTYKIAANQGMALFAYARWDGGHSGALLSCRSSINENPIATIAIGYNGAGGTTDTFVPIVRDDSGTINYLSSGYGVNDNKFRLFMITRDRGGNLYWATQDSSGKVHYDAFGGSAVSGAMTFTFDATNYGGDSRNSSLYSITKIAMGGLLNRFMPRAEFEALAENPWQLFTPLARRIYIPAPAGGGGTTVTPGVLSLTTTKYAPTVTATDNKTVIPSTKALTLSTFAPAIVHGTVLVPNVASLSLTSFAPSIVHGTVVTPSVASLTLTKFAPTVTASDHKIVVPGVLTLTTTGFAPNVTGGQGKTVVPGVASLSLSTFSPTVSATQNKFVTPDVSNLVLATFNPTVTATAHQRVVPGLATLTLTGYAPSVSNTTAVAPVLYIDLLTGKVYYLKALT